MTAVLIKELKDVLRWVPLGMIFIGILCWQESPRILQDVSDVAGNLAWALALGAGLLALALGLLQSLFDQRTDARMYLLHRPVSQRRIFLAKIAAGFAAHTIAWSVPLLVTAVYLSSIGPEKLPVSAADTILPALCCLVSFLFHPAAVWTGCRPARWLGTKWIPLILPLIPLSLTSQIVDITQPMWGRIVLLAVSALSIWTIVAGARHAFVRASCLPAAASRESWSWPAAIGLTLTFAAGTMILGVFLVNLLVPRHVPTEVTVHRGAVTPDGRLWEIEEVWPTQRAQGDPPARRRGREAGADQATRLEDLPADWSECSNPSVSLHDPPVHDSLLHGFRSFTGVVSEKFGGLWLYERHGQLHLYNYSDGWHGTVTPQGLFRPTESAEGSFEHPVSLDNVQVHRGPATMISGLKLIADPTGIYQLDLDHWTMRKLTSSPAESMTLTLPAENQPRMWLWARNANRLQRFSVLPAEKDGRLPASDTELVRATRNYPLPGIVIEQSGEWDLNTLDPGSLSTLNAASVSSTDAAVFIEETDGRQTAAILHRDGSMGPRVPLRNAIREQLDAPMAFFISIPPALPAGLAIAAATVIPEAYDGLPPSPPAWMLIALVSCTAALGCGAIARARGVSRSGQLAWLFAGAALGISGLLVVIAVHPRLVQESCGRCQRRRRVDRESCEHCGAEWDLPDPTGITLIGPRDTRRVPVDSASV